MATRIYKIFYYIDVIAVKLYRLYHRSLFDSFNHTRYIIDRIWNDLTNRHVIDDAKKAISMSWLSFVVYIYKLIIWLLGKELDVMLAEFSDMLKLAGIDC